MSRHYYFKLLSPRLKQKLTEKVLEVQIKKLQFFFNDVWTHFQCPRHFVYKIVTHLESTLFESRSIIVNIGEKMDNLIFISDGNCRLIGQDTFTISEQKAVRRRFHFLDLFQSSWYGDYQILLNQPSNFELVAGYKDYSAQQSE